MTLPYSPVFDNSPALEDLLRLPTLIPFGETVVRFIETFSTRLLATRGARRFPELASLAFWMRHSSLERLRHHTLTDNRIFVARGTAFHVAPANVDTIFVYSWFISLLCGNRNIVRVSSKPSPQSLSIFELIAELFRQDEFTAIRERSLVVRYGHDSQVNDLFSRYCDIRVIWGGDESIREIRKSSLSATACEMTFANKYSFAVFDTISFLNADDDQIKSWADAFYNDSFWFAQMACSSPRLVLWFGGDKQHINTAQKRFWRLLEDRVSLATTGFDMTDYVNKRVAVDSLALQSKVSVIQASMNDLVRVWLDKPALYSELHCGAGLFFESSINELDELLPLLSRQIQTVIYAGMPREQMQNFLSTRQVAGIDRVVPVGKALDFDYIWDGYDLPKLLLREISLR
ncbi:MAG: acyl-CoA reductase [Chlorobiaceae bacterium]